MRLSEAIRLGSLTVEKPESGDIHACAITMALNATGTKFDGEPFAYSVTLTQWPWLTRVDMHCPWCKDTRLSHCSTVYHPFDWHVMEGYGTQITIEQLADFIASIEPPEPKPMTSEEYDRGLAITRCHGE